MKLSQHIIIPEGLQYDAAQGGTDKPQLLLHACCAPCSSAIVEWLMAHDIEPVIYYFNPNIYPLEEYAIRKNESQRHADSLGIRWIDDDYDHHSWLHAVCGLENEPERGRRCEICFYHRLLATARKAQQLGIDWFATTLASSRWKNLDQVNAAGMKAEQAVCQSEERSAGAAVCQHSATSAQRSAGAAACPKFWAQNWRKDGLQNRRNELLKEYNFYNQQYCGCEFSYRTTNLRPFCTTTPL